MSLSKNSGVKMTKRISNLLITLFLVFCLTGCSTLSSSCPNPQIPYRPTLESTHKIRKDINYNYKGKEYELRKSGLYLNQEDTKELLHYINSMENELQDTQ